MSNVTTPASGNTNLLQYALPPFEDNDFLFRMAFGPVNSTEKACGASADDEGCGLGCDGK